ncbi:MAG: hypothetical protein IJZ38_06795 [Bacteroides sp.]|nr:hypothetical protein [Bacteroides sp.]
MNKPNFKKFTKEEAIIAAKKMVEVKREWCECIRNNQSMDTLKDKGIKFLQIN